jgi:lipoprotein-anchoring transpeptidase ErfK/SrfK
MRKSILVLAGILSAMLLVLGLWGYLDNQNHASGLFPANTTINGVDCSALSVEAANRALSTEWNSRTFTVTINDKPAEVLSDIDFEYQISGSFHDALVHSGMNPLLWWIIKEYHSFHSTVQITKVNTEFTQQFNNLDLINNGSVKKTANAYIDMSSAAMPIIPEVYGSDIDREKLLNDILSTIESGNFEIAINEADYYVTPTVLSNDSDLIAKQALYQKYLAFQITYDFGYNQEILVPQDLIRILSYENGKVLIHDKMVREYIKNLAEKYDSAGMSRSFVSNGVKVSVYGNDYGYLMNQSAEIQWLTAALEKGKSVTHTPRYLPTEKSRSNSQYGTTYVEINLTKQHLWIYKNGHLVLSTPVVTGNIAKGTATPAGWYHIYFMQRNRVLRGEDWDGSTYETPVAYWMAFNRSVGLHDAPWRRSFGGTIYRANGSHGCINMPPYMAKAAYSLLDIGYLVIVHY